MSLRSVISNTEIQASRLDGNQWKISKEQYERLYSCNPFNPDWFEGMTQADLFNLKEI